VSWDSRAGSNVYGQELPVYFKSLLLVIRTPLS
jgi:hypothetical protein